MQPSMAVSNLACKLLQSDALGQSGVLSDSNFDLSDITVEVLRAAVEWSYELS